MPLEIWVLEDAHLDQGLFLDGYNGAVKYSIMFHVISLQYLQAKALYTFTL